MLRNVFKHAMQQTHFQWTMIGNADMMLAAALGGQLNMRAGLPLRFVSQPPERADQFNALQSRGIFTKRGLRPGRSASG